MDCWRCLKSAHIPFEKATGTAASKREPVFDLPFGCSSVTEKGMKTAVADIPAFKRFASHPMLSTSSICTVDARPVHHATQSFAQLMPDRYITRHNTHAPVTCWLLTTCVRPSKARKERWVGSGCGVRASLDSLRYGRHRTVPGSNSWGRQRTSSSSCPCQARFAGSANARIADGKKSGSRPAFPAAAGKSISIRVGVRPDSFSLSSSTLCVCTAPAPYRSARTQQRTGSISPARHAAAKPLVYTSASSNSF
jgi:hypothetical protein